MGACYWSWLNFLLALVLKFRERRFFCSFVGPILAQPRNENSISCLLIHARPWRSGSYISTIFEGLWIVIERWIALKIARPSLTVWAALEAKKERLFVQGPWQDIVLRIAAFF